MKISISGLLLLLFALSSCGPNFIAYEKHRFNADTWTYADSVTFQVAIADTTVLYNLYLDLQHGEDYDFQNLYTKIRTTFPSGRELNQVVSLQLADPVGRWDGQGRGRWRRLRLPLQEGAIFQEAGKYTFTIAQHTRQERLPQVRSLAFGLEQTPQPRPAR